MSLNFLRWSALRERSSARDADVVPESDRRLASASYRQAIVEQSILPDQAGRVKFKASWWSARSVQPMTIPAGEIVDVVGQKGITLLVEPAFLLRASARGLVKIQRAWEQKGWTLQEPKPVRQGKAPIVVLMDSPDEEAPKEIAAETWKRFLDGKPIYIRTFKACCDALGLTWQEIMADSSEKKSAQTPNRKLGSPEAEVETRLESQLGLTPDASSGALHHQPDRSDDVLVPAAPLRFVGRAAAMAELDRLATSGAKVITILGQGGLGKTTVARQYLQQADFDVVLECWMAKETENITSAESIVQEWLRRYFQEQPGREFGVSLDRLRQQLRRSTVEGRPVKIGVLVDNLETALDRSGRFVEAHRPYAALLEVLADPQVQSLTLVTSREPLHELHVTVQPYSLPSLSLEAWQQFLLSCGVQVNPPILTDMHRAYGGNAKAMTILSSVIQIDCAGCMEAYWQEHQDDLLGETDLEDLVASHFSRVQQLYPEAYRLLYRLGCYRFQTIAVVPAAGLSSLLWDVPELEHPRIIRFLKELFLIEARETGYALHPVIQSKAVALLKASPDWQIAHQKAAEFWTEKVPTVETVETALMALEAYHHYGQIPDWEAAAGVILHKRDSQWIKEEPLGVSFYRLGLLQPMIAAITQILPRVRSGQMLGHLCRILGDLHWLTGTVHQAIHCHERARDIAVAMDLLDLELVSTFNIGLCQLDLWELEDAKRLFNLVNSRAAQTEHHLYAVGSWFCLALIHSYEGNRQAASELVQRVFQDYDAISLSSWSRCYGLLFLGLTLKNLGEWDQAHRLYDLACLYAEQGQYTQAKARALTGLAELSRHHRNFAGAMTDLLTAQQLLDRIDAKGDLAAVHYQLGLTHQQMNEPAESQRHFQRAIQLFQQMRAPNQVHRVETALAALTRSLPD